MKSVCYVFKPLIIAGIVGLSACGGGGGYDSNSAPGSSSSADATPSSTSTSSSVSSVSSVTQISSAQSSSVSSEVNLTLIQSMNELADFPIGVAVAASALDSEERTQLVEHYFSEITAENAMKAEKLHPAAYTYTFTEADNIVDWALAMGKDVHGHALIWHSQMPGWMSNFTGTPAEWENMMVDHISEIVGHYKGLVVSWDVVNEALDEHNGYKKDSPWYQGFGNESYIEKAFIAARAADPDVDLYYNDFNLESWGDKYNNSLMPMIENLQSKNVPIDGIGFQMHVDLDTPTIPQMQSAWAEVVNKRLKVKLTELDVKATPTGAQAPGILSAEMEALQAKRYKDIVTAYLDVVPDSLQGGITFWGITDEDSWRSPYYPLLFNADFSHKQALPYVLQALTE